MDSFIGIMMETIQELALKSAEDAIDSRGKQNGTVYIVDRVDMVHVMGEAERMNGVLWSYRMLSVEKRAERTQRRVPFFIFIFFWGGGGGDFSCRSIFWSDMMQMTPLIFVTVAPRLLSNNQLLLLPYLIINELGSSAWIVCYFFIVMSISIMRHF